MTLRVEDPTGQTVVPAMPMDFRPDLGETIVVGGDAFTVRSRRTEFRPRETADRGGHYAVSVLVVEPMPEK